MGTVEERPRAPGGSVACPECGANGRRVGRITLLSRLTEQARGRMGEYDGFYFCSSTGCETVYFHREVNQTFATADVRVPIFQKDRDPSRPICYCFNHGVEEIDHEIQQTGRSTVSERIRERLKEDGCWCETSNPQGNCCLGVVISFEKQAMQDSAGTAVEVCDDEDTHSCCGSISR